MPRLGWIDGESEMGLDAALGYPRFAIFSVWIVSLWPSDVRMNCSTRRSLHLYEWSSDVQECRSSRKLSCWNLIIGGVFTTPHSLQIGVELVWTHANTPHEPESSSQPSFATV